MLRTLRAFAWMRWRVLVNSLDRTSAKDSLERLSLAVEELGPLIALGLLVPSAFGMVLLGSYAGYQLPGTERVFAFDAIRVLLVLGSVLCLAGPLIMPSTERTNAVRLLLLPIPRRTLYAAQASGTITDPWILLSLPLLLGIPIGLALRGTFAAAALAFAGGILLVLALTGLSTLGTFVLHLIVRDRRRGELIGLLFILVFPILGLLPAMMDSQSTREERRAERAARAERLARGEATLVERTMQVARRSYVVLPSELYAGGVRSAAGGDATHGALPLLGLAAIALGFHAAGVWTFGRLLDSPASGSRRSSAGSERAVALRIPGLSRTSAAVAQAHVRLAMRTPRGRSILISPLLMFTVLAILMARQGDRINIGAIDLAGGLGLATFGAAVCLLSIVPFAMNQFAIDRAGLTLQLLSPIATRELLVGKAVGNGVIAGAPALLCVLLSFVIFRGGAATLWLSLPIALMATYAIAAPGAAALSALFPRAVDLNSIGRGSNAHGLAGLLGFLMTAAAAAPAILVAVGTMVFLDRPALTPVFLTIWLAVALLASRILMGAVAAIFDRRRENIAIVGSRG